MDNQKAPKKTWFQAKASNGKFCGARPAQADHQRDTHPKKTSFETSDRTKQLMRSIYPINSSGTKQLVIGSDPEDDFKPVITIRKPGYKGVVLSHEGSAKFLYEFPAIHGYFEDESKINDLKHVELSVGEVVEFGYFLQKKAIYVKKDIGDSKNVFIILTASTSFYLESIYDLVKHVFHKLTFNSIEIKSLYTAMLAEVALRPGDKKQQFRAIEADAIDFIAANQNMDYDRVFLELKKYGELEQLA